MTIISDHDLVPLTCDPSCKHTADDLQMTSYNWKNSKESLGSSQDICLIFLITLKNVENIPLSDYRFPPFCIFANTYEAAITLTLLLIRRVPLVEKELLTLPEHLSSPPVFSGIRYSIFSFMCMFCRSLFVLLSFFFWPLCCPFFFDIRILITHLVSSNSS